MGTPAIPLPQDTAPDLAPEIPGGGGLDVRVGADAAGADISQGLDRLGQAAAAIGMGIKQRVDAQRVQDADTAFGQQVLEHLYNPRTGVFAQRGVAAAATYAHAQQQLATARDDLAGNLDDPAQREQFQRAADERMFQFGHLAGGHVVREAADAEAQSAQASILLSTEHAVAALAHATPGTLPQAIQVAQAERDRVAGTVTTRIHDPDAAAAATSAGTTPFDQQVVSLLIQGGHLDQAREWFAAHADTMLPDARAGMARAVEGAVRRQTAGVIADGLLAPPTPAPAPAGGDAARVTPADIDRFNARVAADPRLQADDDLRQQVATIGLGRLRDRLQIQNDQDGQRYTALSQAIVAAKAITPAMAADMASLPTDMQQALRDQEQRLNDPRPVRNDDVAFGAFLLGAAKNPASVRDLTSSQYDARYRALFDDAHYQMGLEMLARVQAGMQPAPAGVDVPARASVSAPGLSQQELITAAERMGIHDPAALGRFAVTVDGALKNLQGQQAGPLSDPQRQKAIDAAITSTVFVPDPPFSFGKAANAVARGLNTLPGVLSLLPDFDRDPDPEHRSHDSIERGHVVPYATLTDEARQALDPPVRSAMERRVGLARPGLGEVTAQQARAYGLSNGTRPPTVPR
jgi:hypothetical protein